MFRLYITRFQIVVHCRKAILVSHRSMNFNFSTRKSTLGGFTVLTTTISLCGTPASCVLHGITIYHNLQKNRLFALGVTVCTLLKARATEAVFPKTNASRTFLLNCRNRVRSSSSYYLRYFLTFLFRRLVCQPGDDLIGIGPASLKVGLYEGKVPYLEKGSH